ncbi:MAG: glycosyltransferase family 39 protein [Candidatus Omnitrophica bacterium]|nr:glycosyltransferase family 39 protein [Candidatus Omnitrophota bacterium]
MILQTNWLNKLKAGLIQSQEYVMVTLIILLGLIIRLGLLLNTVDFHGISNGKIIQALLIINNPGNLGYWTPVHPPAHFLFVIAGLKLFAPLVIAPRIISLGFGLMTIFTAYLYLKLKFNREIALFSILGISLYSLHIIYSIIGTSETSFHFFLLCSLYVYEVFKLKQKRYLLSILGLCVGMASMCRYEGLLLIPFYFVFLGKEKKQLFEFTIYALIIPAIWMLVNYSAFGNAFKFIQSNNFIIPFQLNWMRQQGIRVEFFDKLFFWPKSLIKTLGVGVFSFGVFGLGAAVFKREKKLLSSLFLMFFAVFVLNTIKETLYLQPRYGITLGLILIPFSIYFFYETVGTRNKIISRTIILIMLWTMIIPIKEQILTTPLSAPLFARNTALYLANNAETIEYIIIDDCGDEKYREPIKVLSKINPKFFILMPKSINLKGDYLIDEKQFFKALNANNVTTLVYSPYGGLNDILKLNSEAETQQRQNFLFTLKYKSDPYYIYEIKRVVKNE